MAIAREIDMIVMTLSGFKGHRGSESPVVGPCSLLRWTLPLALLCNPESDRLLEILV